LAGARPLAPDGVVTMDISQDSRIVMTLDAGGTGLKFSAIRGRELLVGPTTLPTEGDDLARCLANITGGFERVRAELPVAPVAISFAFPGPTDYPAGIIGDLWNLPAFRGGVALGPLLEDRFGIPVFINNDGDLFVYGEAIAGFLPHVNQLLEEAGSPRRFRNLFGMTLGTGLGGGIVHNGELLVGDNSGAAEVWLSRNALNPDINAEEGASIRAVRREYARAAGIEADEAPDPKAIFDIGMGRATGHRPAAIDAYRKLAEVAGDVIAQALTLVDGLAVIGGGVAGAHPLFMPALVDAVNGRYKGTPDKRRRLVQQAFNFEDPSERKAFLHGATRRVRVPGSSRTIEQDPLPRTAIGISRLGTSEAVAVGAYAFAIRALDSRA
jgi:glucokinase